MASPERRELLVVNDADRLLINTKKTTRGILEAAQKELGIEPDIVTREINKNREAGKTTQIQDLLSERFTPRQLNNVFDTFVADAKPGELLYEGVEDYLRAIDRCPDIADMILTYGPSLQQEAKLAAAGLAGRPYKTADTAEKGPIIASWAMQGVKRISPRVGEASEPLDIEALSVILVDDKEGAFSSLGGRVGGFVVKRLSDYPRATPTNVALPEGVRFAHDLQPVIEAVLPPAMLTRTAMCNVYWNQFGL